MEPEIKTLQEKWAESLNEALPLFNIEGNIEVGVLTLEPHTRLPDEGFGAHEESHEFAYVIEGEVLFGTENGEKEMSEGDLMYNKPGTKHYTLNETSKKAKILWFVSPPL